MELKDFDRMTLQPGEVLVLRPRRPVPADAIGQLHDYVRRNGIARCVVVPHDFDIMVVKQMEDPAIGPAELTADDMQAARDAIKGAYDAGQFVQYQPIADPLAGWIDAHKVAAPHAFEWDENYYRFPIRVKP